MAIFLIICLGGLVAAIGIDCVVRFIWAGVLLTTACLIIAAVITLATVI